MSTEFSPGSRMLLLMFLLFAVCLSTPAVEFSAATLLARSRTAGKAYLISPRLEEIMHISGRPAGQVLLFFPEGPGQPLTVTLPVPASGYYRLIGTHIYGAWKQGRYGLFTATADGMPLPGKHHGWYGPAGPPVDWPKSRCHLLDINWGVIYLEAPRVELSFSAMDNGLFGIERLRLDPVAADKLTPAEKARRVPTPTSSTVAADETTAPFCAVRDLGSLQWVLPVPMRKVTLDGALAEYDLTRPSIIASAKTIDTLGWKSPPPEGDADLSALARFAWDAENLYVAARVTDDQLAETAGQQAWGSPWGHDSVVARLLPPDWLTGGPRATGPVGSDLYFGLSYYSSVTGPRPLPGGARYLAVRTKQGYDIEAALPFATLGFRPEAGDRLPGMLILSDVDPQKPPEKRFDQYGLPTRGFGTRQVAQLRLLGPDGWGADFILSRTELAAGGSVRFLGYVDVFAKPLAVIGVELVSKDTGKAVLRLSVAKTLAPGRRYEVNGLLRLPADLPPGKYDLRLSAKP
ncbi:MAG: sugar-binding protein [Armatimonadota bacterium]